MLGTASDEIKKSDELWKDSNFKALREQQEKAFGYFGPYEFEMDKKEGEWDEVTTPSMKIRANKILGLLATSWLQLFIDVDDKTRAKRKEIGVTEQLANGAIWTSDRALTAVPSGKSIQSALSFWASIKGGTAQSFLWIENEEGLAVPKARVYDPEFIQWEEGDEKILWFCYRNQVSRAFIKKTYPALAEEIIGQNDGTLGAAGKILLYTFWDENSWKVAVSGRDNWVDEDDHNLGYIPVNIRSCGVAPNVQSDGTYNDTMKWGWQNVFGNDWPIADLQSKILSILSSKATEAGKIKGIAKYDGSASGGKVPEEIMKLGYSSGGRNEMVFLDTSLGQDFVQTVEPPSNQQILEIYSLIRGIDIFSSIDPIAFGQMTRSGSGALAAELRAAALEFLNPFRLCVEESFVWLAEECVRQFKNGKFSKVNLEGIDAKRQKFYLEDISSKDVEERHFACHLVPDRLRDEIQEAGLAMQLVNNKLRSRRTAIQKGNLAEDADREIDKITEELAKQDPVYIYKQLAEQFLKDKDEIMAGYFKAKAAIEIDNTMKQALSRGLVGAGQLGVVPGVEGKPPAVGMPLSPQAQVGQIQAEAGQL